MDFDQTKYERVRMEPQDATRSDENQLSFDDLSQLPLLSDTAIPQTQTTVKKADAPRPKYEMNLAEFPLAFLTTRIPKDAEYLVYEDEITGENGKKVPRMWKVFPHAKHGFLTPSGQSTLFELFQIWKESNFESQNIRFGTIYELIKRKNLSQGDEKTYERIRRDLNTLIGIIIEAENAFWDNEKGAYVDKTFHLFESLHYYHRDPQKVQQAVLPFSYITASVDLWHSVASNAIVTLRDIDSELFHSLTPTEQRLALYLSKMLHKPVRHRRDVEKLSQQLPIITKRYTDVKKQLTRACEGLIKKGFTQFTYRYEPSQRRERDNIVFLPIGKLAVANTPHSSDAELQAKRALLVQDIIAVTGATDRRGFYTRAVNILPQQNILTCLSLTNAAKQQQQIKKSADHYFSGLILNYARQNGIRI
jgi:hypothetical protein